jgi:hypothetical protein
MSKERAWKVVREGVVEVSAIVVFGKMECFLDVWWRFEQTYIEDIYPFSS